MQPVYRHRFRPELLEDRTTPATFTVTTLTDDPADPGTTLREALAAANAANDPDTIVFSAGLTGTIPLQTAQGTLQVTNPVAVVGPGAALLTVSGLDPLITNSRVRVFNVNLIGGTDQVSLSGLTVADGLATDSNGGGIRAFGNLSLANVVVTRNNATTTSGNASGGGLYMSSGVATLDNVTFSNNTADGGIGTTSGGGVGLAAGTVLQTVSGPSTFAGNAAGLGGGGGIDAPAATVRGQFLFDTNSGSGGGGAISTVNGRLEIQNTTFRGNTAGLGGGAIFSNGGAGFVTGSTFSGNQSFSGDGGAVLHITDVANSLLTFENVTFAQNTAAGGGGVAVDASQTAGASFVPVELRNVTVVGNNGGSFDGGLSLTPTAGGGAAVGLFNSIVAGNTGAIGPDVGGLIASRGNNLIGNTTAGTGFAGSDLLNVNPRLGSLAANGGPTQTLAPLAGSPALGGGNPTGAPGLDQRGRTRPANGPTDIGAFQAQRPTGAADSFSTAAGAPLTVAPAGVLANDTANDVFTPLTAVLASPPGNGSVALNSNGGFTYTPNTGFTGTDTFTYTVTDGVTSSGPVTVSIAVQQANRFSAFASGGGAPATVRVFNADGSFRFEIGAGQLFGAGFTGGARVAVGDLTRDGNDDVVVAAGDGGGPVILVFDVSGAAPVEVKRFELTRLGGTEMRPGYFVAVGNVRGDATPEIVVTPGSTAGPVVDVVDFATGAERAFMAFDPNFMGGLRVAVGDTDFASDGYAEVVVTPGPSGGPVVSVFKADALQTDGGGAVPVRQFMGLNDPNYRGGAFVAVITVASEGTSGIAVTRDSFPDAAGTFLDAPLPDQGGQLPPQPLGPNDLSRPSSVLGVNLFTLDGSPDMSPPFTFPVLNPSPTGARVAFGVWAGVPGLFVSAGPLNAARTEFYTYDGGVGVIPQVIDVGFGGRPFSVYPGGGAPAL